MAKNSDFCSIAHKKTSGRCTAAADKNNNPVAQVLACASRDRAQFSISLQATHAIAWANHPRVSNPEKVTSATLAAFKVAQTAAVKATETPV